MSKKDFKVQIAEKKGINHYQTALKSQAISVKWITDRLPRKYLYKAKKFRYRVSWALLDLLFTRICRYNLVYAGSFKQNRITMVFELML